MNTVKIKYAGWRGWARILAKDFDPAKHEIYVEPKADAPKVQADEGEDGQSMLARAKALGIRGAHLMNPDTLAQRVQEADRDHG